MRKYVHIITLLFSPLRGNDQINKYRDNGYAGNNRRTDVFVAIGNSEVLLAAACKSPIRAWNDTDIIEL
jgi:hypothetical protein